MFANLHKYHGSVWNMNELARKRELDTLVERFPNLKQEEVNQALERFGKAINISVAKNYYAITSLWLRTSKARI